jgi:intraflagellar transport protein 172
MLANKEDWNKLVMAAKMVSDANIQDVLKFVSNWCGLGGNAPNYSFK